MLQFCSKLAVILGLRLPDTFKFIEIILTIEHLILRKRIRDASIYTSKKYRSSFYS